MLLGRLLRVVLAGGGASGGESDARSSGTSWAALVEASRRQYALLLTSLARDPLTPSVLVHESVVAEMS